MKSNKVYATIFVIFLLLFFIGQSGYGSGVDNDINVYIITANKLTLLDIEKMPKLNSIIDEGNIGLMNTRGISGYRGGESFATINASAKAYANNASSQFYNLNDEYKKVYENRVGPLDGEYAIGNIQMGRLYNQNENNDYSPYLGALGDNLHDLGFKTAAFGNSDTDEESIRVSALIPMDSKGLIDYGNLDNILVYDMDYPYGFKTDYNKILDEVYNIKSKASLILIDTGDLARLNRYSNFLSQDVFYDKRNLILKDMDQFIGNLVETLDKEKSLLMILSPNSGEERIDGSRLSPIMLWGKGIEKGIVTSSTTNRKGIVSNLDIAPTITSFFNISSRNMAGNPIKTIEKDEAVNYIKSINGRINMASRVRSKTLLTYSIIYIIIMIIIITAFLLNIKIDNRIGKLFRIFLLLLYGCPTILILDSLFPINSMARFLVSLIIILGAYVFLLKKYNNNRTMFFVSFLFFFIIVLDLLLGGTIVRFSVLSHDPIIGARYFGIGNEMVGGFLAVTTLIVGFLLEKYNNKLIPIFILCLSIVIVGHPSLGANVGGTIAILFATIYFILEIMGKQFSLKNIIFILIVTGLVIMIMAYIDIALNPNTTHLGKTLILLDEKGFNIVQNIINRKLLMNIKLVGTSIWTKVLFVNILVQIITSYIYEDRIIKLMKSGLGKGILSGIAGSITGFLLNDSGIMLSAISMNLITIFLLFFIINYEEVDIKWEVD